MKSVGLSCRSSISWSRLIFLVFGDWLGGLAVEVVLLFRGSAMGSLGGDANLRQSWVNHVSSASG